MEAAVQLIRGNDAERTPVKSSRRALHSFALHCFGSDIQPKITRTSLGVDVVTDCKFEMVLSKLASFLESETVWFCHTKLSNDKNWELFESLLQHLLS